MCGESPSIRIERTDNGFVVDAYSPGGRDTPGRHSRSVATKDAHVLHIVKKHLKKPVRKEKDAKARKPAPRKRG